MATLLSCQALSKSYSARPLFRDISFGISDGDRIGLIGPNGSGKSTLLKILAGLETPDSGQVSRRAGVQVGYVPQEEAFPPGATVGDILYAALAGSGDDEMEQFLRVERTLDQIGFMDGEGGDQEALSLSGGWRKRLSIARVLIGQPDVILLDEPTNHLDIEGVLWLEGVLANNGPSPLTYLLISHDRAFLQNVAGRIIELNPAYPQGFLASEGNYADFLGKREEFLASQAHQQVALASVVRREIEWLHRGAKARTTKAKGRIEQAGELIGDLQELKTRNALAGATVSDMGFAASGRQTKEMVVAKDVSKAMGGRTLFDHANILLSPGHRVGLVGRNGSGKTTLLRLITGDLEPDKGTIKRANGLRVIWFDQSRAALDKNETLRDALSPNSDTVTFRGNTLHVSGWAKRFLFRSEQLPQSVGSLSGGEQARVLIARLMLQPADVLILDEPTNDLDIPSLEVLEESLVSFPGALVLVTHDRYLLDRVSTEVVGLMGDGSVRHFAGYDQWDDARQALPADKAKPTNKPAPAPAAPVVPLSAAERRELANMESKIEGADAVVARWQASLEDPAVASDPARLTEAWAALEASREAVAALYVRWSDLEARIVR